MIQWVKAFAAKPDNGSNPWNPHGGERELSPGSWSLTPNCTPQHVHGLPPI